MDQQTAISNSSQSQPTAQQPLVASQQLDFSQTVDILRNANNVLVTICSSPSVDQLAAAIGLTIHLNKLGKHATTVFSGDIPSVVEFLKPEETIEKNTDSLRDFIISLDQEKADKIRYKLDKESGVVRIFITPYKTTISQSDLEFSQGDFNIDAVVALGVYEQSQLDKAIIEHGRILHDARVVTICAGQQGASTLGSINFSDPSASSLGEILTTLSESLQSGSIDAQIATAYLTGIVAETDRFKNDKTTPRVMSVSAVLMGVGANQQLIADELEKPAPETVNTDSEQTEIETQPTLVEETIPAPEEPHDDQGTIEIQHPNMAVASEQPLEIDPKQIEIDNQGNIQTAADLRKEAEGKQEEHLDEHKELMESSTSSVVESNIPPVAPEDPLTDPQAMALGARRKVIQPMGVSSPGNQNEPSSSNSDNSSETQVSSEPFDGHQTATTFNSSMEQEQPVNTPDVLITNEAQVQEPLLPVAQSQMSDDSMHVDQAQQAVDLAVAAIPYDSNRPTPRADVTASFVPEVSAEDVVLSEPIPSADASSLGAAETTPTTEQISSITPPPVPPPIISGRQMLH